MESSISSLMFKGSIPEAISEAKTQRKLFVVYISGEDDQSSHMESSTWMDKNVTEVVSKYCILLQLLKGSTDAAHFSAIYPQNSVPCITAVGYNGMQLWQNEGFVGAEILSSSLEKAWLSLHIQETTAKVISAALASKNYAPGSSEMREGSTSMDIAAPLVETNVQAQKDKLPATSEIVEEVKGCPYIDEEIDAKLDEESSLKLSNPVELESSKDEQSTSLPNFQSESVNHIKENVDNSGVGHTSPYIEDRHPPQKEKVHNESVEAAPNKNTKAVEEKDNAFDIAASRSNEVNLNIRLPNGSTLQEKFALTSALRMVKDFVNQSQDSRGVGLYDLAIPYPRKIFNNQDLNSSLSELGLLNRQALIVVPHQKVSGHQKGGSSSQIQAIATQAADNTSESNGGYFVYARRMLSYMNPFSYLGSTTSSSSSGQGSQNKPLYGPNSATQTTRQGAREPFTRYSPSQSIPPNKRSDDRKSSVPSTSRIGSNIHTLKHDEDDGRFDDRNVFWNGNSTEYGGGDNDGK